MAEELKSLSTQDDPFETHVGRTMCTYDFYEGNMYAIKCSDQNLNQKLSGQGRLDGAFCEYTESEKLEFLNSIHEQNIINMEMESLAFAALTHHAGIRAAVICVTLLNRLNGDQVCLTFMLKFQLENINFQNVLIKLGCLVKGSSK